MNKMDTILIFHGAYSLWEKRHMFGHLMSIVQREVHGAVEYRTETFNIEESEKASLRKWLGSRDLSDL